MSQICLAQPAVQLSRQLVTYATDIKSTLFVYKQLQSDVIFVSNINTQPSNRAQKINMDKFIVSASVDEQLHSQLENLLLADEECAIKPSQNPFIATAGDSLKYDVTTATSSRTIEEQILQLRKQLAESHAIFTSARDSLASISFVGIEKHIARQSVVALESATKHFETELCTEMADKSNEKTKRDDLTSDLEDHINKDNAIKAEAKLRFSDDILLGGAASAVHLTAMKHRVGDVPPLATFFRVVGRLQEGIQRMEQTHGEWAQLNDDLQLSMRLDGEYVAGVRKRVDSAAKAGGVSDKERVELERAVDEAMACDEGPN